MAPLPVPPLPAPIGIFPAYVAKQNECLVFNGRYVSDSYDVSTLAGQPLFKVKDTELSLSDRKRASYHHHIPISPTDNLLSVIIDAQTQKHLCTVRKEPWKVFHDEFYVEGSDGATRLLKLEPHSSGSKNNISFANAMAGGAPVQLLFKSNSGSMEGTIVETSSGRTVADVERPHGSFKDEYQVSVAQGMDLVVVVAICVAVRFYIKDLQVVSMAVKGGAGC